MWENDRIARQHISEKLRREIVKGLLTEVTEKWAERMGYVGTVCHFVPCGPYGKIAEGIGEVSELINIISTTVYEGLDAGGGKAARKVANKVFEKKVTKYFMKHGTPKSASEKAAAFLGQGFDKGLGDFIENGTRGIINRIGPEGLHEPLIQ